MYGSGGVGGGASGNGWEQMAGSHAQQAQRWCDAGQQTAHAPAGTTILWTPLQNPSTPLSTLPPPQPPPPKNHHPPTNRPRVPTSAAMGTVELTGLEMMATQACGQCRAMPSQSVLTMPEGRGGGAWGGVRCIEVSEWVVGGRVGRLLRGGWAAQPMHQPSNAPAQRHACKLGPGPPPTDVVMPARPLHQCLAAPGPAHPPALMLNRSSRVMPGLRGTPAGMTTRSHPASAPPSS